MRYVMSLLASATLLLATGCNQAAAPNATSDPRVAALEKRVEALEARSTDLALKGKIISSQVFGSPLDNFFASEGWWENPYDSGQADCARRCIAAAATHRATCATMTVDADRLKCYQEASDNAANCQRQCSKMPAPQ